jgi:hypothetical protein
MGMSGKQGLAVTGVGETLSEDLASAQDGIAAKAAGDHRELYPPGQR